MTRDSMTCDEAFDALTDPSRTGDGDLRRHLGSCPRCRQMQEVLQPALALFAPPSEEPRGEGLQEGAPGSAPDVGRGARPFLTPEAIAEAESSARELERRAGPQSLRRAGEPSAWLGTAVAAVLFLAMIGLGAFAVATNTPHSSKNDSAVACLWQKRTGNVAPAGGLSVKSRQVVLSCVACHMDAAME